jgi:hypothetical protein
MAERCNWIIFYAHPRRLAGDEEEAPEFYGVFVCPLSRREPEGLLEEALTNRKLFLSQIVERRVMKPEADWGMNERLKAEVERLGWKSELIEGQRTGGSPSLQEARINDSAARRAAATAC